ncbi:MAG TPA: transposase, partial [Pirellulales bacterium]|nr:transposase [Pirellulales bacterium]
MSANAVILSAFEVQIAASAFAQAAIEKGWRVLAATVQSTHTHIVFADLSTPMDKVIATLKYRSGKAILAARRSAGGKVVRSVWTQGQYDVFIFDEAHLRNCIAYVRRHNVRVGLPVDPYAWISKPGRNGPAI